MKVNYDGLWKLLIDKNMNQSELIKEEKLVFATVEKMGKGEFVSMEVLYKITNILNVDIFDVVIFNKQNIGG